MLTIFINGSGNIGGAGRDPKVVHYNWWTKQKGYSDQEFSPCSYDVTGSYKILGLLPEELL